MNPQTYDWATIWHATIYRNVTKLIRNTAINILTSDIALLGWIYIVSQRTINLWMMAIILVGVVLITIASFLVNDPRLLVVQAGFQIALALIFLYLTIKIKFFTTIGAFIGLLIWQIFWAGGIIKKYLALRTIDLNRPPPADLMQWLNATADRIRRAKLKQATNMMYWQGATTGLYGRDYWRVQLEPEVITAVQRSGSEIYIMPRNLIKIVQIRKQRFNNYLECTFDDQRTFKVLIKQQDLEQFQAWRWAGIQQDQRGLWVPPAV